MVSCSGFGLPMHAQLLRLFVLPRCTVRHLPRCTVIMHDTVLGDCWCSCYNRQGRKANRRSRDSYSNRAYSRTQTVRNTGTHNKRLYAQPIDYFKAPNFSVLKKGSLKVKKYWLANEKAQSVLGDEGDTVKSVGKELLNHAGGVVDQKVNIVTSTLDSPF